MDQNIHAGCFALNHRNVPKKLARHPERQISIRFVESGLVKDKLQLNIITEKLHNFSTKCDRISQVICSSFLLSVKLYILYVSTPN